MGETAVINDELMLMLVLMLVIVIVQRAESEGQRGRGRKTDNETTDHGTRVAKTSNTQRRTPNIEMKSQGEKGRTAKCEEWDL